MTQITETKRFSWLTGAVGTAPKGPWDVELCGTERFAAVPSLGSLVPGWSLIVPRRPMVSLREASVAERLELLEFHRHVAGKVQPFNRRVFAFEHGSASIGSVMGCGVDQAHLHIVPLEFDLVELALEQDEAISWTALSESPLTNLPDEGEYISIWEVGRPYGAIGSVRMPVSQWMRRLIARKLGVDAEWNYRTNPHLENIRMTIQQFATT